ncbi:hypothetical protein Pse7367_3219 [Thalassoporum mexicanum PCC 7367]|uniref:TIGR04376 family protein n=1 Tax=Thalassoporum mexicanum TaxID=3457544 RepID=UPI00029F972A|nr:TIGR04376 family protein [Pseudanabaena sp. PCC 7367]AFY71464.1 hypothetical protein Pse7367_3219 [Pseudanabaena sp. PCC 7367]
MGLIEDISNFLEKRLEEFIGNNPQFELQMLDEKLRQQDTEITKLISGFQTREKQLQDKILAIAEEIQLWHARGQKAGDAGKQDLAAGAKQREAALLKEGNKVWAEMELVKKRRAQTQELQKQIHLRQQEVAVKLKEVASTQSQPPEPSAAGFNWENLYPPPSSNTFDDLDKKFREWETEEDLERLKRKMGR